ncbi:TolC family protein [Mucilaginibacter aquatilis]|uniref:Efflux transporter outer membrane subunit n=1 Tax=Mucilaginibacter aquatilis TaxID=1517760 RepID=A0A6I4IEB6_9SPHI|nr:TolC family protein [Mucilaginibacter aquatilis]MVN92138.1 efflux transporter outer membrane subunit [Mucilaginibacter aquatilis]
MKNYLTIAALLILSACKVSKDVQVPDQQLPNAYRTSTTTDTASIARLPWKSFFTETTLQNLIDSAITRNNDLQIAVKNIEQAQLTLKQAKLGYLPSVGLGVTAGINRPSDNSLNGLSLSQFLGSKHIEDYNASANLSWEADIWGKIRSRKAAALATYLQTEEARKAVQTQLVANVSSGYYNLLMLDAQLEIARKNLRLNDSTLRIIRLQFDAGQVTSLAVQQAEAQQLAAARLIPQFEQDVTIQENALSILAGKLPSAVIRNQTLESVPVSQTLSAGLPSTLLSLRPDVRSAELAVERANADVGVAKASMYPSLVITAQGGVNSFRASNWFNIPASLFGTAAAGLTQPLFQRGQLKTQYQVAKVEREKTVLQFRQQVLLAVGEVSDALVRLDKLNQQRQAAATRANTLRQATGNASMLFKNGMANYLEVITAQSNVLQSELELASIKKAQLDATVELYRSVGGGWR